MLLKILDTIRNLALAILVGEVVAFFLLNYVYEDRGRLAFGGEWIVLAVVVFAAYKLIKKWSKSDDLDDAEEDGEYDE